MNALLAKRCVLELLECDRASRQPIAGLGGVTLVESPTKEDLVLYRTFSRFKVLRDASIQEPLTEEVNQN